MALRMDDGTEREFGPGDTFHMPPGHDAWIVGDEACVLSGLNTALSRGWRSALVVLRAPGRAARWRPAPIAQR